MEYFSSLKNEWNLDTCYNRENLEDILVSTTNQPQKYEY